MNEQDHTEKITFGNICLRLLQGLLLGFTCEVPVFNTNALKETLGFRKEKELAESKTIQDRFLFLLTHRISYLIGAFVGFFLFFFVPVSMLKENYATAIYAAIGSMSLGFCVLEGYRFSRARKNTTSYIRSAILFFVVFLVFLLCTIFLKEPTELTGGKVALAFFLFLVSSFLLCFTGFSIGTIFYFFNNYVLYSSALNTFLYKHTNVSLFVVTFLGVVLGYVGYQFFDHFFVQHKKHVLGKYSLAAEKHALGFAFTLTSVFVSFLFKMHAPYYSDVTKQYVQLITILTCAFAGLFVSIGLTIHGYRSLNREDYRELNSLPLPKGCNRR